ncbi:MAG: ABC transporter substrate-binding protein [Chloroflexaceae bacterium]|nr:ABC transporter substrate-binding protein [Chloroflexaceae bacterium]
MGRKRYTLNRPRPRPRPWWLFLAWVWLALVPLLANGCGAEQPGVYRVGIFSGTGAFAEVASGFKAGMAELGYIEGQNIVYVVQEVTSVPDEDRRRIQHLVDEQVDLIFVAASRPTMLTREVTAGTNVPMVFTLATIEGNNLVQSVREPGGNITGVRSPGPEQTSKRLEILLEIAPQVKRVWIGYDKDDSNTAPALDALRQFAASQQVTLVEVPATTHEELQADLAARVAREDLGMDAMILMPDGLNHSTRGWEMIRTFAAQYRIPLGGSFLYTVEQGAVFGNASSFFEEGALAAPLAAKILHGTPAGTIPVVTPNQRLWINYRVAEELGLTVPEGLLKTADEIIR